MDWDKTNNVWNQRTGKILTTDIGARKNKKEYEKQIRNSYWKGIRF